MAQHPSQRAPVKVDDRLKSALRGPIEAAVLRLGLVAQQLGAHHRGQGQGDDSGDQDRYAQGHGEFPEQPADDVAHEKQRDQHRDQRDRQRDDRETYLRRALERCCQRRIAGFDVAHDVLDHDDGVIDDEARRDGERHKRKIVQAVAEQKHDAEGADDGQGHGDARNHRRRQRAQKQKHDHHHQGDGEHELELDVLDRRADRGRAVSEDGELHGGWQRCLELGQKRLDTIHDRDDVGARLPLDIEDDCRYLIHPRCLFNVLHVIDHRGHVGEMYGGAVTVGDDQRGDTRSLDSS